MPIRWIDAGRVSHYRSQSIYHGLGYALTPETPETVVMVVPEDPYVCIGYFQEAAKEVDLSYCRQHKIPVIRRETGGGTVYIDSGQLFVQWVCQPGFLPRKVEHRFQLFNKALIETYKFFGIQAYHHPINDVHVDGRKIVGTGAATIGNAEVVTGNFLFDFDTEIMAEVLNLPYATFRQTIKNSLDNYMTWIKRELDHFPSYTELVDVYKTKCEQVLGEAFTNGVFTEAEMAAIEKAEEKLAEEEWLHSVKAIPSKNRLVKIHAGVWVGWTAYEVSDFRLQVFSQIRNNAIEMIRFYFSLPGELSWDLTDLEKMLISCPLESDRIGDRVDAFFTQVNNSSDLLGKQNWIHAIMEIKREIQKKSGHA